MERGAAIDDGMMNMIGIVIQDKITGQGNRFSPHQDILIICAVGYQNRITSAGQGNCPPDGGDIGRDMDYRRRNRRQKKKDKRKRDNGQIFNHEKYPILLNKSWIKKANCFRLFPGDKKLS
jgi:hypothetical protein